jgi:hypothetical protein
VNTEYTLYNITRYIGRKEFLGDFSIGYLKEGVSKAKPYCGA